MVADCGQITLSDAFTKMVVATLPVGELILIRSARALVFMGFAVPLLGGRRCLLPQRLRNVAINASILLAVGLGYVMLGVCGTRRRLRAPA